MTSNDLAPLVNWTERLVGLEPQRVEMAIEGVRGWGIPKLEQLLFSPPDLDTLVAATLLSEGVETLVAQDVQRTKLMKKIRDAAVPDRFWPTWTEIRSAAVLADCDLDLIVQMEPDQSKGAHADFRLIHSDGFELDLEFKTVGLSDPDRRWISGAAAWLDRLLPPIGLGTGHATVGGRVRVTEEKKERSWAHSAEIREEVLKSGVPGAEGWAAVQGVTIVGHYGEGAYARRAAGRLAGALSKQLRTDRDCGLGLWWNNGAPYETLRATVAGLELPPNVQTLLILGQAVAVPWAEINVYIAPMDLQSSADGLAVRSGFDDGIALRVLERFESSAGLRCVLLRDPETGRDLLRRDGTRAIDPFNLLFDSDPRSLADPTRRPSPVQDVQILE